MATGSGYQGLDGLRAVWSQDFKAVLADFTRFWALLQPGAYQRGGVCGCCALRPLEDSLQEIGDLEDGAIVQRRGIGAVTGQIRRLDQLGCGLVDFGEAGKNHADLFFHDPCGVVALLRQRPRIALHDHRQLLGQRLADATGSRLADEKIRELHVFVHARRTSLDERRRARFSGVQSVCELVILAAYENELYIEVRAIQSLGDFEHHVRTVAAEKHEAGGEIGPQPEANAAGGAILDGRIVKPRMQNHSGCAQDAVFGIPDRARLFHGAIRTADQILLLILDPEVRRIVRDVGENRYKRPSRKRLAEALADGAIEMWHEGHDHVRLRLFPMRFHEANRRAVIHPNRKLKHAQELRASKRPASAQHRVVNVLDSDVCVFLSDVERVEQFLQVG